MTSRSLRRVALLLTLALSALVISIVAAQEETEAAMYDGRFMFTAPDGYTINEGNLDFVRVEGAGSELIIVAGPDSLATVIADQVFETEEVLDDEGNVIEEGGEDDPAARLRFYLNRTGYDVQDAGGLAGTVRNGIIESFGVTLDRRGLTGSGSLVDLGNGREAVVLTLSESGTPRESATVFETLESPADIVDLAVNAGDFTALVTAVTELGLEETLRGGEYTVFAPTDAAFEAALEALEIDSLTTLVQDDPELLESILLYHVVEGEMMLTESGNLTTLNGAELPVTLTIGEGVNVVAANLEAFNGVVHVIDSVLLPPPAEESEEEAEAESED